MKKVSVRTLCTALALAFISLPVFSVDFGGTVTNTSKAHSKDFTGLYLKQQDGFNAWIRFPLTKSGKSYFVAEGNATYQFTGTDLLNPEAAKDNLFLANLELFKLAHTIDLSYGTSVTLSAGRFYFTDLSGVTFSQASDGISVQYASQNLVISSYTGYTGLLNAQYVTELNASDSTYTFAPNSIYAFASPYYIAQTAVSLPYLFANQTFTLEALAALGTPGLSQATNAGYSRFYGTIAFNGPLSSKVFYNASSTFSTEYVSGGEFRGISNLSKLSIDWFTGKLSSVLSYRLVYASGENGFLKPYKGFTSSSATYALDTPEYTGLLLSGISGSIKPAENLLVSADMSAVFNCATAEAFGYDGVQFGLNAGYQLFTDVFLGLNATQYISKATGADSANKTAVTANIVIAF